MFERSMQARMSPCVTETLAMQDLLFASDAPRALAGMIQEQLAAGAPG